MRELKIKKLGVEDPQPEVCLSDNAFKRAARKHQSDFRWKYLQCGHDHNHKFGKYGAYLKWNDALSGKNFYAPYWPIIEKKIQERYPESEKWQLAPIYANMLRSEHIPFNFFVPMQDDLEAARKVFNEVLNGEFIQEILEIKIEYAPDKQYALNDGTSFDTFVVYRHKDGKLGGIGIEIKYTEVGYLLKKGSKEERDIMNEENKNYITVTKECGYYKKTITNRPLHDTPLIKNDYRQIWRNHILGASMLENKKIEYPLFHFNSVTIYTEGNTHFAKVIPQYEEMLSDNGKNSFCGITYENFFHILGKYYFDLSRKLRYWILYLQLRYEINNN